MTERAGNRARVMAGVRVPQVQRAGDAACARAPVFAAVYHDRGLGGTAGLPPGLSEVDTTAPLVIELVAIPLCVAAAVLAPALVRPWGGQLPRGMLSSAV